MTKRDEKQDIHFPTWSLDNPLRRLLENPKKYCTYITQGSTAADLGSGPGYYTISLAKCVGPEGRVIAVDSDPNAIKALEAKAKKWRYENVEAHVASAHQLGFIQDKSVDFILAKGLLCCVAPANLDQAVNEIKRIIKPTGRAYLSVAKSDLAYVNQENWQEILRNFQTEQEGQGRHALTERWAVVTPRQEKQMLQPPSPRQALPSTPRQSLPQP